MTGDLAPIILFFFLYSFVMTIVKNISRKNILKLLVNNNLLENGQTDIKLDLLMQDRNKSVTNYVLPVALGMMGLGLGLIVQAYMIVNLSDKAIALSNNVRSSIELGAPLMLSSIGVTIAYLIEKRENKENI